MILNPTIELAFQGTLKIKQPVDMLEIHGCYDSGKGIIEQCESDQAEFFTLYVHYVNGGIEAIFDCKTKKDAEELRTLLLTLIQYFA